MIPLPVIVTLGEPAGIGPELSVQAWQSCHRDIPMVMIGDAELLRHYAGPAGVTIREIASPDQHVADQLCVINAPLPFPVTAGQPDLRNADSVVSWIEAAVRLVRDGQGSSLVTNPINKQVLQDGANFAYPGHTEFLGALCNAATPVMMLVGGDLRVVPVTIHIPLSKVATKLTADLLRETLLITHQSLRDRFGIPNPRLAVAGLNPHAGEGGKMGQEEITLISPLLDQLRNEGLDLIGPLPADTMFHSAARANYDAAICMYHDQALIPVKTLAFDSGVNLTLGLPIVRTSPDHGTAFDIAGKQIASPNSLIAAIRLAASLS